MPCNLTGNQEGGGNPYMHKHFLLLDVRKVGGKRKNLHWIQRVSDRRRKAR
jgi:hypothetical protein